MDESVVQPVQPTQPQINSTQQPQVQQSPQQTTVQPQTINPEPVIPKKKSRLKIVLLTIGGIIVLVAAILGFLIFRGFKDSPIVQEKVTSFMQNVSSGNYDAAYALTSKEFKQTTSMESFTKAMSIFKAQYSEFQSQDQIGFNVEANAGQPTLYQYSAVVTYTDGETGKLIAVLVKEDGDYKILSVEVNVGIDRIEKFQQNDADSVLGASSESKI